MANTVVRMLFLSICLLAGLVSPPARAEPLQLLTLYWPPFIDRTDDGGVEGVAPALVQRILEDAGLDLKPRLSPWPRTYKSAQTERNILVFTMVRFPEREQLFTWISPLFVSEQGVLVYNRDNPPPQPNTVAELRKFKLCVTPGNSFHVRLKDHGFVQNENMFEFETVFPDKNSSAQWYFVEPGCDFKVTNWGAITSLLRRRGFSDPEKFIGFYPIPEQILGDDMRAYLAASKDFDPQALDAITRSAKKLRQNGELMKICRETYKFDDKTCSMLNPD